MFRHHGSALRELRRRSVASEEQCGPRNETAAAMLGIVCMARCSSGGSRVHVTCHVSRVTCRVMFPDAGCQNKRKLCLCDSVCGLSCVRPEKECPELPDPEDGQVHLTGRHFQVRGPVVTVASVTVATNARTARSTPATRATGWWAWTRWCARPAASGPAPRPAAPRRTTKVTPPPLHYSC